MKLSSQTEGSVRIVVIDSRRIDASVAIEFKNAFRAAVGDDVAQVIMDLSQVEFIDSSGLGAVVASMKLLGQQSNLILAGLTPAVAKVFKLTRMDTVFKIYETVESAKDGLIAS